MSGGFDRPGAARKGNVPADDALVALLGRCAALARDLEASAERLQASLSVLIHPEARSIDTMIPLQTLDLHTQEQADLAAVLGGLTAGLASGCFAPDELSALCRLEAVRQRLFEDHRAPPAAGASPSGDLDLF